MGCTCSCDGGAYDDAETYGVYVRDPLHRLTGDAAYEARVAADNASLIAAFAAVDDTYSAKSGGEIAAEPDEDTLDGHRGQYVLGAYIRHGITGSVNQFPAPPVLPGILRESLARVGNWISHVEAPFGADDDDGSRSTAYTGSPAAGPPAQRRNIPTPKQTSIGKGSGSKKTTPDLDRLDDPMQLSQTAGPDARRAPEAAAVAAARSDDDDDFSASGSVRSVTSPMRAPKQPWALHPFRARGNIGAALPPTVSASQERTTSSSLPGGGGRTSKSSGLAAADMSAAIGAHSSCNTHTPMHSL